MGKISILVLGLAANEGWKIKQLQYNWRPRLYTSLSLWALLLRPSITHLLSCITQNIIYITRFGALPGRVLPTKPLFPRRAWNIAQSAVVWNSAIQTADFQDHLAWTNCPWTCGRRCWAQAFASAGITGCHDRFAVAEEALWKPRWGAYCMLCIRCISTRFSQANTSAWLLWGINTAASEGLCFGSIE